MSVEWRILQILRYRLKSFPVQFSKKKKNQYSRTNFLYASGRKRLRHFLLTRIKRHGTVVVYARVAGYRTENKKRNPFKSELREKSIANETNLSGLGRFLTRDRF